MEAASMPVERVLITPDGMFLLEITDRIRPLQWDCLEDRTPPPRSIGFPMEKIELYYRLLAKLETEEERQVIRERIRSQLEAEEERDSMHRTTREWEEYQFEAQLYRNAR